MAVRFVSPVFDFAGLELSRKKKGIEGCCCQMHWARLIKSEELLLGRTRRERRKWEKKRRRRGMLGSGLGRPRPGPRENGRKEGDAELGRRVGLSSLFILYLPLDPATLLIRNLSIFFKFSNSYKINKNNIKILI